MFMIAFQRSDRFLRSNLQLTMSSLFRESDKLSFFVFDFDVKAPFFI